MLMALFGGSWGMVITAGSRPSRPRLSLEIMSILTSCCNLRWQHKNRHGCSAVNGLGWVKGRDLRCSEPWFIFHTLRTNSVVWRPKIRLDGHTYIVREVLADRLGLKLNALEWLVFGTYSAWDTHRIRWLCETQTQECGDANSMSTTIHAMLLVL